MLIRTAWDEVPREKLADMFIIKGLVSSKSTLIYGPPKEGKSLFAAGVVASLVSGKPFLGRPVTGPADGWRPMVCWTDDGGHSERGRSRGSTGGLNFTCGMQCRRAERVMEGILSGRRVPGRDVEYDMYELIRIIKVLDRRVLLSDQIGNKNWRVLKGLDLVYSRRGGLRCSGLPGSAGTQGPPSVSTWPPSRAGVRTMPLWPSRRPGNGGMPPSPPDMTPYAVESSERPRAHVSPAAPRAPRLITPSPSLRAERGSGRIYVCCADRAMQRRLLRRPPEGGLGGAVAAERWGCVNAPVVVPL